MNDKKTDVLIGSNRHCRTINKTLCTFLTSNHMIKKYWDNLYTTCFDRHDPLSKEFKPASYGNAGHFSPYAVLQFNRPDVLYDVPKMLMSSYGPLALKWSYIPKMFTWF